MFMARKTKNSPGNSATKTESFLAGTALAYGVARGLHKAHIRQKAAQAAKSAVEVTIQPQVAQTEVHIPQPKQLTEAENNKFNRERSKLAKVSGYLKEFFNQPSSVRKLLPRDGVYHSAWAFHAAPTYSGLKLDQSEFNKRREFRFNSGLEHLVALGKRPLTDAIEKSVRLDPNAEWHTLLSSSEIINNTKRAKDAAGAKTEKDRIIGVMAALEGAGFDTPDLAFAKWEDHKSNSRFAVVPYDEANILHRTISGGSPVGTSDMTDPGLMVRYTNGPRQDDEFSIAVRTVDIADLRDLMPDNIPENTPDPWKLSHQPYKPPARLASTQVGGF